MRVAIGQIMLAHEVLVEGLVEFCHGAHRAIDEVHQIRKSVAEKAADAQGHVNAWSAKLGQRDHRDTCDASTLSLPDRAHAQQGQHLADVIAMRAHGGSAPDDNAYGLWIRSLFGKIFIE